MTQHNTTLGFEIEYLRTVNLDRALRGMEESGVKVSDQRTRYNTDFYDDRWVQAYDCSCGWEIKSHPIRDTSEVEKVMKAIREAGGSVNRTCGLHVHMGVANLTFDQQRKLVKLYLRYEQALNTLLPRSRRGYTDYASDNTLRCAPTLTAWDRLDQATTVDDLQRVAQPMGRYSKLNIGAFRKHGTFEFRGHQGTLNFKKIDAWASLLGAMYNSACAEGAVPASPASFDEMLAELLPFTAASQTNRTYRRPRTGTKTAQVWETADMIVNTHPDHFEERDGRMVMKSLAQTAALISVLTGTTLNTVRTSLSYWATTKGYARRVSSSAGTLETYLRRRNRTLAR